MVTEDAVTRSLPLCGHLFCPCGIQEAYKWANYVCLIKFWLASQPFILYLYLIESNINELGCKRALPLIGADACISTAPNQRQSD